MKRKKMRDLRKKIKLTQEDVATIVGISRSYYGLIETGQRNPNYITAKKIADVFKCPIQEIFPDMIFFCSKCYDMKQINEQTA
ncbi:MAG: helix-turn-helix transcriptional regulator [Tepidanaerobacteraceae bacterium]